MCLQCVSLVRVSDYSVVFEFLNFRHRGQGKVVVDPVLHREQFPRLFDGKKSSNISEARRLVQAYGLGRLTALFQFTSQNTLFLTCHITCDFPPFGLYIYIYLF